MKTSKGHLSDAVRAGVSLREFAAACGKSHVWVKNKCDAGLIPRYDDGSIPLDEGLAAFKAITPATLGRPKKGEVRKPEPKREPVIIKAPPREVASAEAPGQATGANFAQAFNKAKLAEKTYIAKMRELEYRQKLGELVERSEVEADAAAVGAALREKLLAIGPSISSKCEGQSARVIEGIIEDAINNALGLLKKSEFTKKGG